jgi:hypothetical protein
VLVGSVLVGSVLVGWVPWEVFLGRGSEVPLEFFDISVEECRGV